MSAHQMSTIEEFCTDVLILNRGKTVLQGNLKEIKDSYKVNRLEIDVNKNITPIIEELGLEIEMEKDNQYKIKIDNEDVARKLLDKVVKEQIEVNKFEIQKPTLNDIFIEKVGEKEWEI